MTNKTVFIGVDVTSGSQPFTYAVLNDRLRVEELGGADLDGAVDAILRYETVTCAIGAPSGPNRGLLADPGYRERVGLPPEHSNYSTYRVCEYELRRRGIGVSNTSPDLEMVSRWTQECWQLYDRLRAEKFVDYPRPGSRRLLEAHPHAAFTTLVGRRPYTKTSFEGMVQRQLVLYDNGIEVADAMYVFQEWTRHRLLTGQVNMGKVHTYNELDAMIAAYTAFLVEREPHETTSVGDSSEGVIVLPVGSLQDSYS